MEAPATDITEITVAGVLSPPHQNLACTTMQMTMLTTNPVMRRALTSWNTTVLFLSPRILRPQLCSGNSLKQVLPVVNIVLNCGFLSSNLFSTILYFCILATHHFLTSALTRKTWRWQSARHSWTGATLSSSQKICSAK